MRLIRNIPISTGAAVLRDGVAFGLLLWATMLTISAFVVVAWLSRRKRTGERPDAP